MRRALIETISRSEKRKDVLLLLKDGPVSMPRILEDLEVSRNALLPQIKILDKNHLITRVNDNDTYTLTKFGKLIVADLIPLLSTLETLEDKMDYWTKHNIDCIPEELFYRIRELEESELVEPELYEALELGNDVISKTLSSKWINIAVSFYHTDFPSLFMEYAENKTDFKCIFTKEVFLKMEKEDGDILNELIKYPGIEFYIYKGEMDISTLIVTEDFMHLQLLTDNYIYDPRYIMAHSQKAIEWSKELFQHFIDHSTPLSDWKNSDHFTHTSSVKVE